MGGGNGWTIFIIFSLNTFNLIFTIFAYKNIEYSIFEILPFLQIDSIC